MIRQDESGDAGVALEWGFVRWLPTDTIAVRAGRMSLPVFAVSDYREVGYANVLLRPIEDVYSLIPLRRFDGIDVTLDSEIGGALVRWQAPVRSGAREDLRGSRAGRAQQRRAQRGGGARAGQRAA